MNKDEILRKAREENKGVDEVQRSAESKAGKISMAVGASACMLLYLLDDMVLETEVIGDACWVIYSLMMATRQWICAAELKKKSD